MARSCSWSGLPRPMEASSRVTATSRHRSFASLAIPPPLALQVQADRDRPRMTLQPLRPPEGDGGGAERPQGAHIAFQDRASLHEVKHAKARGEPGRAGGGQNVVGATYVIAD